MVIDVVDRAERIVMPAVAGQLFIFINEKMSDVQMLMGGEPITALEKEIRCIVVPGAARINVARSRADVR